MKIPTFVINLKSRTDRHAHILSQFTGKPEFNVKIVEAKIHRHGTIGLWNSIKHIVADLADPNDEFILICEDDHLFTRDYSCEFLLKAIEDVKDLCGDVLLGGVSWFNDAVQITDELFWIKRFSGTQFVVVFKKFFNSIIEAEFSEYDTADTKISSLSDSIYFTTPFISVQKEFGYSDATEYNNRIQRVESLFFNSAVRAKMLSNVRSYYSNVKRDELADEDFAESCISTYVINLPERPERLKHVLQEFEDKPEFDVTVVEAVKHTIGGTGLWLSIRNVIKLAIENDDDVIVICEDDHEFSTEYVKNIFFKSVVLANQLGCDYLNGGTGQFDLAVPINEHVFWTNHCLSGQFLIIYKKFFQVILNAPVEESVMPDIKITQLAKNKMLIVPIISTQKNFGYSDVTPMHNENEGIVQQMFSSSSRRLLTILLVYLAHQQGFISSKFIDSYEAALD